MLRFFGISFTAVVLMASLAAPAMAADRKPPTITITRPAANAQYTLNQVVTAKFSCQDNNRVQSCVGTVPSGSRIQTAPAGSYTFQVKATDRAGNTAMKTVAYTVAGSNPGPAPSCQAYYGLTYDDGPNPTYTTQVKDALASANAKATFFVIGENLQAHPALAQQVAAAGHSVQNHTWTHPDLTALPLSGARSELSRTSDLIQQTTGVRPTFFRPPYGEYNRSTIDLGTELGMALTAWTTDTNDWAGSSVTQIVDAALKVPPAGIILMHDAYPNTVAATPQIVSKLRERGFCPGRLARSTTPYHPWEGALDYYVEAVAP